MVLTKIIKSESNIDESINDFIMEDPTRNLISVELLDKNTVLILYDDGSNLLGLRSDRKHFNG